MRNLILAAGLITAIAGAAVADIAPVTPKPVVEAERAFAADGAARGIRLSFLAAMADDALMLAREPVRARDQFKDDDGQKGPLLEWWPVWAGIARSGDLGFTTGPYTVNGKPGAFYFTVWKKQPDGRWKWVFDGGAGADPTGAPAKDSTPAYLPVSRKAYYPEGAASGLAKAEDALAAAAAGNLTAAYKAVLACDGRIYTVKVRPGLGCSSFGPALAARPQQVVFKSLGRELSSAGDLAWTYGSADWTADGAARKAHYVRVWQQRDGVWKLVFDELVVVPPPPPKTA